MRFLARIFADSLWRTGFGSRLSFAAILAGLSATGLALSPAQDEAETVSSDPPRKDGVLWAGLFLAGPGNQTPPPDEKAARRIDQLQKAFPDRAFTLAGETEETVFSESECRVALSKDLSLKIDSMGTCESGDGLHLHVQVWQRKRVLLKADVILRRRPLFIECPRQGQEQAVMALKLLEKKAGADR